MKIERYKSLWLSALLVSTVQMAAHAQGVDLILEVTDGANTEELHFGLDPAATDGIDSASPLDEVEQPPAPPSGVFDARFIDNDIPIMGLGQGVLRDFRNCTVPCASFSGTEVHEIRFQRATEMNITLSWNLPSNVSGTLEDVFGGGLVSESMSGAGSFTVPIPAIDRLIMTITYEPVAEPDIPDIAVAPTSHDYGNVEVTSSASQTFVVSNEGTADLTVSAVSLIGADAAEFSISAGGAPFTLGPGGTQNVEVTFSPTSPGAKAATLRLESDDPDEDPFDVPLSGIGIVEPEPDIPDIAVAPTSHDYGNVEVTSSASQTFVVSNEGTADLNVSAASLIGADAGEFSITSGGAPFTLAPAATQNVEVSFDPTSTGPKAAVLRLESDDPDEDPFDVELMGSGVSADTAPPDCELIGLIPNGIQVGVQDLQSGLSSVTIVTNENANVSIPAFASGTTDQIIVAATRVDVSQSATLVLEVTDMEGNSRSCDPVVTKISAEVPQSFALEQNYPNPFNPATMIRFHLTENVHTSLRVYDLIGREVAVLINEDKNAGVYEVEWDGRDRLGNPLPSGLYLYRIDAGTFTDSRRMVLLK